VASGAARDLSELDVVGPGWILVWFQQFVIVDGVIVFHASLIIRIDSSRSAL